MKYSTDRSLFILLQMVVGREKSLEQCCILLALIIFCTKSTCQSSITSNESMPITQVLNTGIGNRNQSISSTPTSGTVIAANTLKTDGSMKLTSTVKMTFDQMQSPGPNSTGICKYFTPYITWLIFPFLMSSSRQRMSSISTPWSRLRFVQ